MIAYHCNSVNGERGRPLATPGQALIGSGTRNLSLTLACHLHLHLLYPCTSNILAINPDFNKKQVQVNLPIQYHPIQLIVIILFIVLTAYSRVTIIIVVIIAAFSYPRRGRISLKQPSVNLSCNKQNQSTTLEMPDHGKMREYEPHPLYMVVAMSSPRLLSNMPRIPTPWIPSSKPHYPMTRGHSWLCSQLRLFHLHRCSSSATSDVA